MEYYHQVSNYISNFEYVPYKTPLSDPIVPIAVGVAYLAVVFGIRWFMTNRKRMDLLVLGSIHNVNMLLISIITFIGMVYGFIQIYMEHGVESLFCDSAHATTNKGTMYFWIYIFYLSKYYELLDTVFICFRKSKLRFLHLYHHWITAALAFASLHCYIPQQWTATILNAFIHIPMYYYYLVVSLGYKVWWKRYITIGQITQFVLVNILHWIAFFWNRSVGGACRSHSDTWGNEFGIVVINSYLILFIQFFIQTREQTVDAKRKKAD